MILWCYLIWHLVTLYFYFDPALRIWLNSMGISAIIGIALMISVSNGVSWQENRWQTFRLFLMPFCVSSFSSLIEGKGYNLIFPPDLAISAIAVGLCLVFVAAVLHAKWYIKNQTAPINHT